MARVQNVRDEILSDVRAEGWDWRDVEQEAQQAHSALKQGRLPNGSGEIGDHIADVCRHYYRCGYLLEDIREAVDGVNAKAVARQRLDDDHESGE